MALNSCSIFLLVSGFDEFEQQEQLFVGTKAAFILNNVGSVVLVDVVVVVRDGCELLGPLSDLLSTAFVLLHLQQQQLEAQQRSCEQQHERDLEIHVFSKQ